MGRREFQSRGGYDSRNWVKHSSFSAEFLEQDIRRMLDEVKRATGASEEQVTAAFVRGSKKITEVNCLREV